LGIDSKSKQETKMLPLRAPKWFWQFLQEVVTRTRAPKRSEQSEGAESEKAPVFADQFRQQTIAFDIRHLTKQKRSIKQIFGRVIKPAGSVGNFPWMTFSESSCRVQDA